MEQDIIVSFIDESVSQFIENPSRYPLIPGYNSYKTAMRNACVSSA